MTRQSRKAAHEHGKSGSLDESGRRKLLDRFRRIEGQIRGIGRMIEEDRYCPDVLMQISAVQESLRGAAQLLLQSHLRHCVTGAIRSKDAARTEAMYDELADLFTKYGR